MGKDVPFRDTVQDWDTRCPASGDARKFKVTDMARPAKADRAQAITVVNTRGC